LLMHRPEAYFEWFGADIAEQFAAENEKEIRNGYGLITKYYPGIALRNNLFAQ